MSEKFCVVLTFVNSINLHHTKFICNFVASKKTPKYTPKMIIKRITLKNFQCISNFDAAFDGNVYLVKGENEMGKSTLLKAICALLTGNRDEVLKSGEDKGFASAVIDGNGKQYTVELKFTKANPRGTISIKDGNGMKSDNVTMLQHLLKYKTFDASEFVKWSETAEGRRKQVKVIKSLLAPEVSARLDAIEIEVAALKDERKGINAECKTLAAQAAAAKTALGDINPDEYAAEKDINDLVKMQQAAAMEMAEATQHKMACENAERNIENYVSRKTENETTYINRLAEIKARREKAHAEYARICEQCDKDEVAAATIKDAAIAECESRIKTEKNKKAASIKWLSDYAERTHPDYAAEINAATEYNKTVAAVKMWREKMQMQTAAETKANGITAKIEELTAEKGDLITASKLPIQGLTFDEDGLMLDGIPFAEGKTSDSQIMEVATKLCIASNPTVNVFCLGRGESLGAKKLAAIVEIARANGFQGFIEQVERGATELTVEEYTEK